MSTLIKLPTVSYKKIEIPTEKTVGKMNVAIVHIKDLPRSLDSWREVNPRDVNLKSGVSEQIRGTLEQNPETFILRNRGITLIVAGADFDPQNNVLKLELDNKELHGILDGGHTIKNIWEYLDNEESPTDAYVKVEILQGIKDVDEAVKIVDARNRSNEVRIASLENLLGHFDGLKKALDKESYSPKIAYKENQLSEDGTKRREIPIEEILSYIICFDIDHFDHTKHPIKAYSGKASVVKHYKEYIEDMKKYFPLAPDILELRDIIYTDIPQIWNKIGNDSSGGKWGKIVGVTTLKEPKELPFTGRKSKFANPSGYIYPVLAAFRPLVRIKDGNAEWKEKPAVIFNAVSEELAKQIAETAKRTGNPNQVGKDPNIWSVCYQAVEREIWKRKLS